MTNRRSFLKKAGLGAAAISIPRLNETSKFELNTKNAKPEIKFGVASYSLRKFSQEKALDMTLRCGVDRITFKDMHLPLDSGKVSIKKTLALTGSPAVSLNEGIRQSVDWFKTIHSGVN